MLGKKILNQKEELKMNSKKPEINNKNPIRLLSLFSGCGGIDLGFEGDFEVLCASVNNDIHNDWEGI